MNIERNQTRISTRVWWFLAATALALAFANGRWYHPIAAWAAPLLLVLYLDTQSMRRGLLVAFAVQQLAFAFNWQGMIPVPGIWYYVITATYAAVYFVPFVIHRWLSPRLPGFAGTLVLPTAWVAIEFVLQQWVTPYGSWVSLAYTQVEELWLLQLASVAGLAGISFLILWFASLVGWVWRHRADPARTRSGRVVFACILLAVLVWGQYRLTRTPDTDGSTRVTGITPSAQLTGSLQSELARIRDAAAPSSESLEGAGVIARAINDDLLQRTRAAIDAGAQIVVWSETAALMTARMEAAFLDEVSAMARESKVVMIVGVGVWNPGATPPLENKAVIFRDDGTIASEYGKARPIAGSESGLIAAGGSGIAILDNERSRIGVVICHDLDFADFVRGAGREKLTLLVGPSADWDEITPFHANMAIPRAVENGCYLFRPCAGGLSLAVDPFGRVIASALDEGTAGNVLAASLPNARVATLHARTGNLFAWLCLAALVVLFVTAMKRRGAPGAALVVTLLLGAIAAPELARAGADRMKSFEIKDQFDVEHTEAELQDRVVLVFGSDRKGSAYNSRWVDTVRDSLRSMRRLHMVKFVEVADLRGVPFFIKGMVKGKFPKAKNQPVLLDWKGWFAQTHEFEKDSCTISLFDGDGALVHQEYAREIDSAQIERLMGHLRTVLSAPVPPPAGNPKQ